MVSQIPSEEQVLDWFDSLSNWGRWGEDDQKLGEAPHKILGAGRPAALKLDLPQSQDPLPGPDAHRGFLVGQGRHPSGG